MFKLKKRTLFATRKSPVVTRSIARQVPTKASNSNSQAVETTGGNMSQTPDAQKLLHEIYTNTIEIPQFSGESDSISLDDYIARIQTYIVNKGIRSEDQKIQAFMANIHPEKGNTRQIVRNREFEEDIKD